MEILILYFSKKYRLYTHCTLVNKFTVFFQWQHSYHHTETIFSVPNYTTHTPNPAINYLISTSLNSTLSTHIYIHLPVDRGFPCSSDGKESACNVGDLGSIPGLGRSPREGKSYPLQYPGLENFMDCIIHGVTKSRTRLSDFHPWTEEPGRLQSRIARVRCDLATKPPPQSAKKIPTLKQARVLILDLSPETKNQAFLVQILNLPFSICAILDELFKFSVLSFPHLLNGANDNDYFWVILSTKWASTCKTKQHLISTVWEFATIIICYWQSSHLCLAVP